MKIAVVGGASSYTPELIEGLLNRLETVPVTEIALMDPAIGRLGVIAGLARRMVARSGAGVTVHETTQLDDALDGARYVISQIRVGGAQARIRDEKLGLRHGLVGQETTGVGGFACALRTIPAVLKVARTMEARCPGAFLLNFANPAGLVTEALFKYGAVRAIGLCNIPIGVRMEVARRFDCGHADVELGYAGLNHLAWVSRFAVGGEDVTEHVLTALIDDAAQEWEAEPVCRAMQKAMRSLGLYCNPYLQYYYATPEILELQRDRPTTRGEDVVVIEEALFKKYADPDLSEKPAELSLRGGAHYSTAACELIDAIENDRRTTQIVCCRNGGALPALDNDVAIEVPAVIGGDGASALRQPKPSPAVAGLLHAVKAYESLTVEAAVHGDREAAFQAMLAHPLMPGANGSEVLLSELLDLNRDHLGGTFFDNMVEAGHGR